MISIEPNLILVCLYVFNVFFIFTCLYHWAIHILFIYEFIRISPLCHNCWYPEILLLTCFDIFYLTEIPLALVLFSMFMNSHHLVIHRFTYSTSFKDCFILNRKKNMCSKSRKLYTKYKTTIYHPTRRNTYWFISACYLRLLSCAFKRIHMQLRTLHTMPTPPSWNYLFRNFFLCVIPN